MNKREKILLYTVCGLLVAVMLQYGLSSFRGGIESRRRTLHNSEDKLSNYQEEEHAGLMAETKIGQYRRRSLPSDTEAAQSQYKAWLESLVRQSQLTNPAIDYVGDQGSNKLFRIYTFRISGNGNIQHVSEMLADFHRKNYLQRVKKLSLRPLDDGSQLQMGLDVEAIALLDAAPDQAAPQEEDPRIIGRDEALVQSIVQRNMFAPPNRAPQYSGKETLTASVDTDFRTRLQFEDPDSGDRVESELVGELPEGIRFDRGELIGRPQAKGEFQFTVRAWDNGLPSRQTQQTLVLRIGDPPPPPPKPDQPPAFDDSQQAMLTGLVQSRGQWNAWISVRTQNKLLKLKVGDAFEVGSVKGKIVEITDRVAVFESNGKRSTLTHNTSLAEAVEDGSEDDDVVKDDAPANNPTATEPPSGVGESTEDAANTEDAASTEDPALP